MVKIFLVANTEEHLTPMLGIGIKNVLLSFYYKSEAEIDEIILKNPDVSFIIDSGAHTLQHNAKEIDYEAFFTKYLNLVKRHKDRKNVVFVELDIDNVVGYKRVTEWREKLLAVRDDTIIVWHKWSEELAGRKLFEEYCKTYKYIGIPNKDLKNISLKTAFKIAKENKTKVHGFAMTKQNLLRRYEFDTVDSSYWTASVRFGNIFIFDRTKLRTFDKFRFKRLYNVTFDKIPREKVVMLALMEWKKLIDYFEAKKI